MKKVFRLLPALVFFGCVCALAQGAGQPAVPAAAARPSQADLQWQNSLRSYQLGQTGHDGRELTAELFAERQIKALAPAKFDRDGNGRFDEAEFHAWLGAVRAAIPESPGAMKRFDTNQDGKLDDREWKVVVEQLAGKG